MIIFQNIHRGEGSKQPNIFQEYFLEGVFSTLLESSPKKTFVISRKASRNFSKGVRMIIFKTYTSGSV